MTRIEIDALFHRVYKRQTNLLTPLIVRRGQKSGFCYEISEGDSISGGSLYGVTVLQPNGIKRPDLNECFHSLKEAETHIFETLRAAFIQDHIQIIHIS